MRQNTRTVQGDKRKDMPIKNKKNKKVDALRVFQRHELLMFADVICTLLLIFTRELI